MSVDRIANGPERVGQTVQLVSKHLELASAAQVSGFSVSKCVNRMQSGSPPPTEGRSNRLGY